MAAPLAPFAQQHERVAAKIVAGIERLGHVLLALHARAGLEHGLTSLQVFLLLEVAGSRELGVRELAARFSLSRPTVSRSLASLQKKGLLEAMRHPEDGRRVVFSATCQGQEVAAAVYAPLQVVLAAVEALPQAQQVSLWVNVLALLLRWERVGLMTAAKACPTCRFFRRGGGELQAFCDLLQRPLTMGELRLDCPDHQPTTKKFPERGL